MSTQEPEPTESPLESEKADAAASAARRDFLAKCGKLAVITPPAITLMLAATSHNYAAAASGVGDPGRRGHRHHHHHHYHDRDHDKGGRGDD